VPVRTFNSQEDRIQKVRATHAPLVQYWSRS